MEPLSPKKKRAKRQPKKSPLPASSEPVVEEAKPVVEEAKPVVEEAKPEPPPKPKPKPPASDFSKVSVYKDSSGSEIFMSPPCVIKSLPDGGVSVTEEDGKELSFGKKKILSTKPV